MFTDVCVSLAASSKELFKKTLCMEVQGGSDMTGTICV
jgi:hypothetical protein